MFLSNGTEHIEQKIAEAIENGTRTATVSGEWEIARAVRLPSHVTLILENCHLRMADGVYDNMFVNEHHGTEEGTTVAGTDRNISILGRGEAILDGGEYNGLSEKNQRTDGRPPIYKNNLLLFTNVDGFKIDGLSICNQRWWALNFIYCANGYLGHLDFCASDIRVDENGVRHHGLTRATYDQVLVKNADGIDLRQGCHDIVIEHITGFTEDDMIALTALNGRMEQCFAVEGMPMDLCRIEIRDVRGSAYCTLVRLLNQGDVKLHDVCIDGVIDESRESAHLDHGLFAVRIGDKHLYGTRHATVEETYNITVKNICGAGRAVMCLAGEIGNLVMYSFESTHGAQMIKDDRQA